MKKRKLNEAEYNLSITDLNTTDGDILSQIVSMANQADNGGMGDVPATPIEDPYASDMGTDVPMDSGIGGDEFGDVELAPEEPVDDEFPSVEEDPTIDDMGYGVPVVDEPSDDFMGDEDVEENNFNEEEPYTHPMLHQDSGNLLTEDESKKGYSVMVKDKEYAHIDTENEYSDDEIINQFLKQYMAKTGKEFPYIDQIVVKHNGDVEEDVLLPKDGSENEFIPESEENWIIEDDDEGEMTEDQLNEEIDSILWSAGVKGCSDKEEKGVNTKSLMEDGEKTSNVSHGKYRGISDIERKQCGARENNDSTKKYKIYQNRGGEIIVTSHNLNDNYMLMDDSDSFDEIEEKMNTDWEDANWYIYDENLFINNDEAKNSQIYYFWENDDESDDLDGHIIDISSEYGDINESENPEMNMKDCDAPNPAEMNLDDKKKKLKEGFYVATNDDDYVQGGFESEDEAQEWIYNYCNDNMLNPEDYTVYEDEGSWEVDGFTYDTEREARNAYKQACECEPSEDHILMFDGNVINSFIAESAYEMNLDEANGQKMMFYVIDANGDLVEGGFETRADARNYIQYVYNGTLGYPKQDVTGWRIKSEPATSKADDPDFGEEIEESAYSPKLKDPNRKAPTRANYQDVNVNAAGKDASLGFEYPAPTGGKITLSPKAGKIMETAKHLMSKANGDKKDKLLSRYTFKLMNEGVSFSDAKRILSKF